MNIKKVKKSFDENWTTVNKNSILNTINQIK